MLIAMRTALPRVVLAGVLLLTAGCTGDSGAPVESRGSGGGTTDPSTAAAHELTRPHARLRVTLERLGAGVPSSRRPRLKRALTRPVDSWMRRGFLTTRGARPDLAATFSWWTPEAARLARRDRGVTTRAALGSDLATVVAVRRTARLFTFASAGRLAGATARVRLRLLGERREGTVVAAVVAGDLFLTPQAGHWRIFGYDLTREVVRR